MIVFYSLPDLEKLRLGKLKGYAQEHTQVITGLGQSLCFQPPCQMSPGQEQKEGKKGEGSYYQHNPATCCGCFTKVIAIISPACP
jgi:hypothetical protein